VIILYGEQALLEMVTLKGGVAMSNNGDGMLTRWERKILLDKLH